MIFLSLLMFATFIPYVLHSQDWTKRYFTTGSLIDEATTILPATNNRSIVIGSSFTSQAGWNVVVISYSSTGSQLWTVNYNNPSNTDDKATCATTDSSGNILVGGISWSDSTGWDYLMIKLSASGVILWIKRYNSESMFDDISSAMATDVQGNIFLTGSSGYNITTILTVKFDASGYVLWQYRHNPQSAIDEKPVNISIDHFGNIIVCGNRYTSPSNILAIKYSSAGNELWNKVLNRTGAGSDKLYSMRIDVSSNIYLAGSSASDALVMKLDSDGNALWTKTYNGTGNGDDRATAIQLAAQNNIVVTARSVGTTTGADIATIIFNSDGTQQWVTRYEGQGTASDNAAPTFAGATAAKQDGETSARISWASAFDDQTEADDVTYMIFVSNTSGGQNFNTPTLTITQKTFARLDSLRPDTEYFVVVRAKDKNENIDTNTREIKYRTVKIPLAIKTSDLPGGVANTPYTAQLQAKGGKGNYTWSISSGSLPIGLQLDASGKISGTPTVVGESQFVVTMKDANNDTASRLLSITIDKEPLTITTNTLASAIPGQRYLFVLTAKGGTPPYSWDIVDGYLPWGIRFSSDGTLKDTAIQHGGFTFTVRVKDSKNDSMEKQLTLTSIAPQPLHVTRDTTISTGIYWYSTVTVDSQRRLNLHGIVELNATDSVEIRGSVIGQCSHIKIATHGSFRLFGEIKDTCKGTGGEPKDDDHSSQQNITVSDSSDLTIHANEMIEISNSSSMHMDAIMISNVAAVPIEPHWENNNPQEPIACHGKTECGKNYELKSSSDITTGAQIITGNGKNGDDKKQGGGNGGNIYIRTEGKLIISGSTSLQTGNGGDGANIENHECPAIADAFYSEGGHGGDITLIGDVIFEDGSRIHLGDGGRGGDALASTSLVQECKTGCKATAVAGNGGAAGNIGIWPYTTNINGKLSINTPKSGDGGDAVAEASNGGDCPICPSGRGGDGGEASAYGGSGSGVRYDLESVLRRLGAPAVKSGNGGDATSKGGKGGNGATCCDPVPKDGGNGGTGGRAVAWAGTYGYAEKDENKGQPGEYLAIGGDGGNGGDGKGPGSKGSGGEALGSMKGSAMKGADGSDGKTCTISGTWYCYFSSIPDGVIQTGSSRTLDVYKSTEATPQNKVGTIEVTFSGTAGSITKNGDSLKLKQGAKITFNFTTFTGGYPNPDGWPTWYPTGMDATIRHGTNYCGFRLIGYYNSTVTQTELCNYTGAGTAEVVSISASATTAGKFDSIDALASYPINIDHWGFRGTWIDP